MPFPFFGEGTIDFWEEVEQLNPLQINDMFALIGIFVDSTFGAEGDARAPAAPGFPGTGLCIYNNILNTRVGTKTYL
jgi:hypothetical protein